MIQYNTDNQWVRIQFLTLESLRNLKSRLALKEDFHGIFPIRSDTSEVSEEEGCAESSRDSCLKAGLTVVAGRC